MDLFYFAIVTILLVAIVALAGCFAKVRADNQHLFLQNLALQEEIRATRSAFKASNDRLVRSHRQSLDAVNARLRRTDRSYEDAKEFCVLLEDTIKHKQKALNKLSAFCMRYAFRSPESGLFSRCVGVNIIDSEVIIYLADDSRIRPTDDTEAMPAVWLPRRRRGDDPQPRFIN